MAGSTTGVPMSPGYGGYQTATPPPYYTTTYATTSYCTEVSKYYTKSPEFYNTSYAAPSHYSDALKYYSAPSYYTTKATEYYMTTYAAPSYYTEALKYYSVLSYLLHRSGKVLLKFKLNLSLIKCSTNISNLCREKDTIFDYANNLPCSVWVTINDDEDRRINLEKAVGSDEWTLRKFGIRTFGYPTFHFWLQFRTEINKSSKIIAK